MKSFNLKNEPCHSILRFEYKDEPMMFLFSYGTLVSVYAYTRFFIIKESCGSTTAKHINAFIKEVSPARPIIEVDNCIFDADPQTLFKTLYDILCDINNDV
jgi:hypothetical protein